MFTALLLNASLTIGQVPGQPLRTLYPTGGQMPSVQSSLDATPIQSLLSTPIQSGSPTQGIPYLPGSYQDPKQNGATNGNGSNGKNGNGEKNGDGEKKDPNHPYGYGAWLKPDPNANGFLHRFYKAYYDQFFPPETPEPEEPEPARRTNPSPWRSPPFPVNEYQGYPLLGVPYSGLTDPIQKALEGDSDWGQAIKDSRIKFSGWVTAFGDVANSRNSNVPASYWINPNTIGLDQLVFRLERYADTVQQDHIDWGFRSIGMYGQDYRYTTAGGWGSNQLLKHNMLDGWDPVEQYFNIYIPGFLAGTDIRVGRWIACPDIESQYAPDNFLGSHSILFTYDTYTQTGIMITQALDDRWILQAVLHAGTDMAPWYPGATPTMAFGARWVSRDNSDAFYTWVNALNTAEFRHFNQYNQPLGHDNFNYAVTTWEHSFGHGILTKTEAYFMWQRDAELGGTPSAGPIKPYGGGGGDGTLLPGTSLAYGVLNYSMVALSERTYFTVRNEWYRDERGMRTGVAGNYTSHTVGISHQFNDVMMVRPEIGYYRNWNNPAFDNGQLKGDWIAGFDFTYRF